MTVELTSELEAKSARVQETLDRRYDDLKSGKAELVPAEEVLRRLRAKGVAWREEAGAA